MIHRESVAENPRMLKWMRRYCSGFRRLDSETSLSLAERMGKEDFVPTDGWLSRWKKRNGICYKVAHGEKKDADITEATSWVNNGLPQILQPFAPTDVYNADETGIYYRATPDGTLTFR